MDIRCIESDAFMEMEYQRQMKDEHGCDMDCPYDWASYHCKPCEKFDWSKEPAKKVTYRIKDADEECKDCNYYLVCNEYCRREIV